MISALKILNGDQNMGDFRKARRVTKRWTKNEKSQSFKTGFRNSGGASRSRTEVHGFAIRCIATLPRRLSDFLSLSPKILMVPRAGLEPAQRERRGILNPLCLPIPPPGQRNHAMG